MGLTFLSRAAKLDAVHRMTEMSGTPASERTQQNRERNWTPAGLCPGLASASSEDESFPIFQNEAALNAFNDAMGTIAKCGTTARMGPLTFQLKTKWAKSSEEEQTACIKKATEACRAVCSAIAPADGEKLFQAIQEPTCEEISSELTGLIAAYKYAPTKNLKTQILSLYAHRYPADKLIKIHKTSGQSVTEWEIRKARAHANTHGPGAPVEKTPQHRVRMDTAKADHFLEFIDRPYFHQDVAYGTRTFKLDSGCKLVMPNVIRTVARTTMIAQYLKHCEEEQFESLSRTTLYRILEVREASQRKALQGLDNIAADGASAFDSLSKIVEELERAGVVG